MRHIKKKSVKWKALTCVGLATIALMIVVFVTGNHVLLSESSSEDKPITEIIADNGTENAQNIGNWLNGLSDEQLAELDIAFDAAVDSGYQGTKEEWVSKEVMAHLDSRGNTVVVLPDGGEFTITKSKSSNESRGSSVSGDEKDTDVTSGEAIEDSSNEDGESSSDKVEEEVPVVGIPTLSVDSVVAQENTAEITVPVRIHNNPGLLGLTLSISYDEPALRLISAENGEAFDGVLTMTRSRSLDSGCLFTWDGIELESGDVKDGEILVLRFAVQESSKGLHTVAVRMKGNAIDADIEEVEVVVEDGGVVVE